MNRTYCDKECPIGKEASRKFLNENNSAYDAALDFISFTEKCFTTCPFKAAHAEQNNKN